MSWNAHTDYVFNQYKGHGIEYLYLGGSEGGKWGESGNTSYVAVQDAEVKSNRGNAMQGCPFGGQKYMFIREIDGIYVYNCKGKGAAVYPGKQYTAMAFSSEGYKAEHCIPALEKLKTYLTSLGYN